MAARPEAQAGVEDALEALRLDVLAEMERRGLNASYALVNSIENDVVQTDVSTTGTMTALDYWVNAGSGTPPGQGVREFDIAQWMEFKGFEGANIATAFFITRKINREGSKDYRLGNPNAFETAIDGWENSQVLVELASNTANEYGDSFYEVLRSNLSR